MASLAENSLAKFVFNDELKGFKYAITKCRSE